MPDAGKLAACFRPIGGQIGDITLIQPIGGQIGDITIIQPIGNGLQTSIHPNIPHMETPGPMDPGV